MNKRMTCCAKTSKIYCRKTGQITSMNMDCFAETRSLMRQYKLVFLSSTRKHYFIKVTAQHWLDTPEQEERMTSSEKQITCSTWPQMYKNLCSSTSLAGDTGRHKSTSCGCNYFHQVILRDSSLLIHCVH